MTITMNYLAPFAGAVSRDMTAKLSDFVTPEDFGAVGDNTVDDTLAVQAALDTGRNVLITGRHRITQPLLVKTIGQKIQGSTGPGYMAVAGLYFADLASGTAGLNVLTSGVVIDGLVMQGNPQDKLEWDTTLETTGSMIVFANQAAAYTPLGQNRADVDLTITNCSLGNAKTLVKVVGRGLRLSDCNLVLAVHVLEIEWPSDFVQGTAYDSALKAGMRAYTLRDNRIHGCSGGYVVRNIGAQKNNIHGLMVIGNFIDTNIRMFRGVANESLFSDNVMIHGKSAGYVFTIEGGDCIRIADNTFHGMEDTGNTEPNVETHRELVSGIYVSNASNVAIVGNNFKRVLRDVVLIASGVRNVSICDNVMKNVGMDNDDTTISPPTTRYGVRVAAPLDGLLVRGNVLDNPLRAVANPPLVGVVAGGSLTNWIIDDNILPTLTDGTQTIEIGAHAFASPVSGASADTSRRVVAYTGDGQTSQEFTFRFTPVFVLATIVSGPDRGRSMAVSVTATAGSDQVEISGRTVKVKDAWNASGISYTLLAFT